VLQPENKAYPVIRPKDNLEIFGVVVGQFRKYRWSGTPIKSVSASRQILFTAAAAAKTGLR